jgi:aspartate 1-decarboxylase
MLRKVLKSKIHRATITQADLNYQGSIAVDEALLKAADIAPFESVHVWNISNGSRLETYAVPAEAGSGCICINGAAARHSHSGDLVIIATFTWQEDNPAVEYTPKLVFVDAGNRQLSA